jgi:ABC-type Na+ efflux pump permease subunit
MGFLGVCFRKDFHRILKDPLAIVLAVGLPILIALMLRLAFGGSGGPTPTAKLLIADHDDSFLSGFLAASFDQGPLADLVDPVKVTEEDGRAMMEEGKASGLLIIPKDFATGVLEREPTTLTLITNPAQRILPGILEGGLAFMVDAVSNLQQILGDAAETIAGKPPAGQAVFPDSVVANFSVTINQLIARADPYLIPPAIKLETVVIDEEKDQPSRGFGDIFFPSVLFMALLFAGQNLSDDVWKERLAGTLRRTLTTPQSLALFFLGKVLAVAVFVGLISVAGLLAGRFLFSLTLGNIPLAAIWATASGTFMLLLFTLIQLSAGSQRGGNVLATVVLFPLLMLGGAFFPFEAMPDWLARIGRLTPNGWALLQLKHILWGTIEPAVLLATAGGLLLLGLVLFLAGLARLRAFARG